MSSRVVTLLLIALLVVLHAQLWFGRGSVGEVQRMRAELAAQNQRNSQARAANLALAAEVRDLKEGLDAVEERARMELGMLKPNEIFVQTRR
jgi:cell division protein FtsB